ncbi:thioesterase family protein [uncultured Nitratireductor sp.]|uniref:thioesterase family protein n=1 Tax=uncultured Nitratireductor sp. TaxID=520953 RepID=UPI0025F92CF2|nr:thioesterase family protein [uncultured Nitratireductor sp.]
MQDEAPHRSSIFELQKDWIDFNGHLNMAYYTVLFDRAYEETSERFGMGAKYAQTRRLTTYTAEIHLCYVRELHLSDRVQGTYQLLDHDEKRLHSYQELRHAEEGWLAATCETLTLHIDMAGPRVTPFPDDVVERIEAVHAVHKNLSRPERAGRSIAIRRRRG